MTNVLNINGQRAVRINAEYVKETEKAILLNCEGDEQWFPKSSVRNNKDGTWDVTEYMYNQKFGDV